MKNGIKFLTFCLTVLIYGSAVASVYEDVLAVSGKILSVERDKVKVEIPVGYCKGERELKIENLKPEEIEELKEKVGKTANFYVSSTCDSLLRLIKLQKMEVSK